jgi:hypothetical protein
MYRTWFEVASPGSQHVEAASTATRRGGELVWEVKAVENCHYRKEQFQIAPRLDTSPTF